jgi:arylesterase/paraoxonase
MKFFLKLIGVVLILLTLCVTYILNSSGTFNEINPHFDGTVEELSSPAGVEDITIDAELGLIYLSSTDRWNPEISGDLYVFDIEDKTPKYLPLNVTNIYPEFRPHGISLLKKYGKSYLFAISHEFEENYVYCFEINRDSLVSAKRFSNELFISPNDVVAIDTSTFYLTNDHGLSPGKERDIKDYLMDKNGYVVLFKNGNANKVSQDIAYANGINVSNDGKYLFVSSSTEATLFVYDNVPDGKPLKMLDKRKTYTALDNIEIDSEGNLYIGSHPQLLKFVAHAKGPENKSPSQILKIIYLPDTDYKFLQEELYLNNGEPLSGSSVATFYKHKNGTNDIWVGSVFESKILRLHRNL